MDKAERNRIIREHEDERRRQRARGLMYKKPICSEMNFEHIQDRLCEMQDEAADIDNMLWDDDTLEELLGDDQEAFEFKTAFRDLQGSIESMYAAIQSMGELMYMDDEDATATFDLFFPAAGGDGSQMYGYDEYVEDYFPLDSMGAKMATEEAGKKLKRLTKEQILDTAGVCLRIARQFIALEYRHDCLSAAFDILRGHQEGVLQMVRALEDAYKAAEEETMGFKYDFGKALAAFDKLLSNLPERLWIE